jgi:hypothetical protein
MAARHEAPGSDLPAPPLASPEEEVFWGKVSAQVARRRRLKHTRHQRVAAAAVFLLIGLPSSLWMVQTRRDDAIVDFSDSPSTDNIGIGSIGTKGRGGGTGGYGSGVGGLGGKHEAPQVVEFEDDTITENGSLAPEQLHRVIRMNRGQIRYCHESLLARYPALAGEVPVRIDLRADGTVAQARVMGSTVNNPELEACVAHRVSTWRFPRPTGEMVFLHTFRFQVTGGK